MRLQPSLTSLELLASLVPAEVVSYTTLRIPIWLALTSQQVPLPPQVSQAATLHLLEVAASLVVHPASTLMLEGRLASILLDDDKHSHGDGQDGHRFTSGRQSAAYHQRKLYAEPKRRDDV